MLEDDRTRVSETRPDRQRRMPPCAIDSQIRGVGHDHGGRAHRTCPLRNFEQRSTWLMGATWEIPDNPARTRRRARPPDFDGRSKIRVIFQYLIWITRHYISLSGRFLGFGVRDFEGNEGQRLAHDLIEHFGFGQRL